VSDDANKAEKQKTKGIIIINKMRSLYIMPKLKTNRGAKKRFKVTGSGKCVHKASHRRHILTKKSQKRKRHLRGNSVFQKCDRAAIRQMINE